MKLFERRYKLTVGTLEISSLRVSFEVVKQLPHYPDYKAKPNTCHIQVWNLSQNSRKLLSTPTALPVHLQAGYVTGQTQLYLGQVRHMHDEIQGADIVTVLSTGDSEKEIQHNRLHVPIGNGLSPADVLPKLVQALGIPEGNTKQMIAELRSRGAANVYGKRAVLSGHAAQELTDFCRSAGIEWSVQDGHLQFLDLNKPLENVAVEFSAASGMVGSPTVDNKGFVEARHLLAPLLNPGRAVSFNALNLKGGYRIVKTKYIGDTHGTEWYAEITAKKY